MSKYSQYSYASSCQSIQILGYESRRHLDRIFNKIQTKLEKAAEAERKRGPKAVEDPTQSSKDGNIFNANNESPVLRNEDVEVKVKAAPSVEVEALLPVELTRPVNVEVITRPIEIEDKASRPVKVTTRPIENKASPVPVEVKASRPVEIKHPIENKASRPVEVKVSRQVEVTTRPIDVRASRPVEIPIEVKASLPVELTRPVNVKLAPPANVQVIRRPADIKVRVKLAYETLNDSSRRRNKLEKTYDEMYGEKKIFVDEHKRQQFGYAKMNDFMEIGKSSIVKDQEKHSAVFRSLIKEIEKEKQKHNLLEKSKIVDMQKEMEIMDESQLLVADPLNLLKNSLITLYARSK